MLSLSPPKRGSETQFCHFAIKAGHQSKTKWRMHRAVSLWLLSYLPIQHNRTIWLHGLLLFVVITPFNRTIWITKQHCKNKLSYNCFHNNGRHIHFPQFSNLTEWQYCSQQEPWWELTEHAVTQCMHLDMTTTSSHPTDAHLTWHIQFSAIGR